MKLRQTVWTLVGSAVVFVACSSYHASNDGRPTPGTSDTLEDAVASGGDAVLDAIQEVRDALADATGLEVGAVKDANADTTPGQTGGTRLKAKILTFADGAQGFQGWFDSARNEDCYVTNASDGKQRCLPLNGLAYVSNVYFADAACTQRAFLEQLTGGCTGGPIPKYAAEANQGCGPGTFKYFPVTGLATLAQVYVKSGASCTAIGSPAERSLRALAVGAEVPPSAFVEVTNVTLR
jgi:hypothetical protein